MLIATVSGVLEAVGVGVITLGILLTGLFAVGELRRISADEVYQRARNRVGRSILLGLELLVAADIIRTVAEMPTLSQLAVLAAIIGIRTFLSFTLEIELTGRLPWRGHPTTSRGGDQRVGNDRPGS